MQATADGGGGGEVQRRMAELRVSCEREIAAHRGRAAAAASSFRRALLSARSLTNQTLNHREKLHGLKDRLRELEMDLREVLTAKASKESTYEVTGESIATTAARNEQLKNLLADQRARKDEYAAVILNQLDALEALEAKSNEDAVGRENLEEAIKWYHKVLGFQVVGGEGVKFIFNNIDLKNPEKEYSFCIKLDNDKYSLPQCDLCVKDSDELMKELNRTNDLFKFVRIMREKLQAAMSNVSAGVLPMTSVVCLDSSSVTVSSPPPTSVDSKSERMVDQSHSSKSQVFPPKRGRLVRATTPISPLSSARRSPRLAVRRCQ